MYVTIAKDSRSSHAANEAKERCFNFLNPLLDQLDRHLDLRLVRTIADTVTAVIRHRPAWFAYQ
jgi:hypothetical protein